MNQETDPEIATDIAYSGGDEIILRPVKIVHPDGSVEKVFVEDHKDDESKEEKQRAFDRKLQLIYVVVGILALSLSTYLTIRSLRKK